MENNNHIKYSPSNPRNAIGQSLHTLFADIMVDRVTREVMPMIIFTEKTTELSAVGLISVSGHDIHACSWAGGWVGGTPNKV